jgi:hypothetical protein
LAKKERKKERNETNERNERNEKRKWERKTLRRSWPEIH